MYDIGMYCHKIRLNGKIRTTDTVPDSLLHPLYELAFLEQRVQKNSQCSMC
jgi:hypothetical protein